MSEDGDIRRSPTAEVARRLDKIEEAVGKQTVQLAEMAPELRHLKELLDSRFSGLNSRFEALEHGREANAARIGGIDEKMNHAISEPTATPAGRALLAEISEFRQTLAEVQTEQRSTRDWTLKASGALALLIAAMPIIAPLIQGVLGLPR